MPALKDVSTDFRAQFLKNQLSFNRKYKGLFDKVAVDISLLANDPSIKFTKAFKFPRSIEKKIERIIVTFQGEALALTEEQIEWSWRLSQKKNDKIVRDYLETLGKIKIAQEAAYTLPNIPALKAFLSGKHGADTLSESVWKVADQLRAEMSTHLGIGVLNGDSSQVISQRIRTYLNNPEAYFRRVRDAKGRLVPSQAMIENKPGQGVYNSAYKNAMRVARTNTNMAYLLSDHIRWSQMDMVIGVRISLSDQHPEYNYPEICEVCEGEYPKDFIFTGWHPQCYSSDTEVYTKRGWLLFKDVRSDDLVLSLKANKDIEWVKIAQMFQYHRKGEMVRFHNRALDLLVTPEHKMIYLTKEGKYTIRDNKTASEYTCYNGGLYRGCEYQMDEKETIQIGDSVYDFNLFSEFLGYYLSEGSFSRKYCVIISQDKKVNPDKYDKMSNCLLKMGFKVSCKETYMSIWDKSIWQYVQEFGKSSQKFVPDDIKNSGIENIKSFLRAYNIGDGSIKRPKKFIGNRGGEGTSLEGITYSTSSIRMSHDLGELILKIGNRPSFSIMRTKGMLIKFRNGEYRINNDQILVSECRSKTATVFKKEIIQYDDFVYDIELEKNHILYVRRNGKCVWGSNCLCNATPIMASSDNFLAYLKGEQKLDTTKLTEYPDGFKSFITDNLERLSNYKSIPYWIQDNKNIVSKLFVSGSARNAFSKVE